MHNKRKLGFTLIELLAVIVILAVILAIAIPSISNMVNSSKRSAFESDAKMVLKAVKYKIMEDEAFNPTTITLSNMEDLLGISSSNYSKISFKNKDPLSVILEGSGKWNGLYACGTSTNMHIFDSALECGNDLIPPTITLAGDRTVILYRYKPYVDPGFTAVDNIDGNINNKVEITSDVNVKVSGEYKVTYKVTDSAGNQSNEVSREVIVVPLNYMYNYTGDYQTFTAQIAGHYKIELWGASGGKGRQNDSLVYNGGAGAYTKGSIELNKDDVLYLYVGGSGANSPSSSTGGAGGYNGGGKGGNDTDDNEGAGGGGGATDIRLLNPDAKYRYVRDYVNGNSINTYDHWVEMEVYDINGNLISGGKNVISSNTSIGNITALTDGVKTSTAYVDGGAGPQYMELDLGSEYSIGKVIVWHYFSDGRYYKETKTELYSEDRSKVATIYDSAHQGVYTETSAGKAMTLNDWNNYDNLKARIMVAAGGAGSTYSSPGGAGGTLTSSATCNSSGATQTSGYQFGVGKNGTNSSYTPSSGAGNGYYGGNSVQSGSGGCQSATGGSSFVSGYEGCNAIDETGTHTNQPIHYSNKIFTDAEMIDGTGLMPTLDGSSTMNGNMGNGYAKITALDGVDNPPTLTLNGEEVITIVVGSIYDDAGVTATDSEEENITNKIVTTGTVNPNLVGTYTVTYTITDRADNTVTISRTIIVSPKKTDSLLSSLSSSNFSDGNHDLTINGETYNLELININGDTTYTNDTPIVSLGNDTADQRMLVVKYNGNLTIDSGVTLTATTRKKGMLIYVAGTLTNGGTISMTARGASAEGQNVYLWKNTDGTYEYIPSVGGAGGSGRTLKYTTTSTADVAYAGNGGIAGSNRATGGGGSGGIYIRRATYATITATVGAGGAGTSYSGGSGSGSVNANYSGTFGTSNASSTGGAGGVAYARRGDSTWAARYAGGGAGNPGGNGMANYVQSDTYKGSDGTGGLLIIYADNLLNNGSISSDGSIGGYSPGTSGGSSGGGSINIFTNNTWTNTGSIVAKGGAAQSSYGSAGGNGSITIGSVSTGTFIAQ